MNPAPHIVRPAAQRPHDSSPAAQAAFSLSRRRLLAWGLAGVGGAWGGNALRPLSAGAATAAAGETPLNLAAQRHLFLDERLIDPQRSTGLTRTLNPPQTLGRVLRPERPWESLGFIFYSSVVDDGDQVKLYYGSYRWDSKLVRHFCLATSRDGMHFERAALGTHEFAGRQETTNWLSPTAIETSVFLDPHAGPDQRYRMIYTSGGLDDPARAGVYTAASPDGIRWTKNPTRLLPFVPDSQHTAYWDPRLRKYVIYLRAWDRQQRKREVCRVAVDDLDRPWPYDATVPPYLVWGKDKVPTLSREFPIVMAADADDPPNLDIYTNVVTPYPAADRGLLAFPAVYFKFQGPEWKSRALSPNDGNFEVQFAASRDGIAWRRWRQPYVAAGWHDGVDLRLVSMARGLVQRGRWIYQYFVGWPHTHGRPDVWNRQPENAVEWTKREKGGLFVARQRQDGFVSLDSAYAGGRLTTPPVVFQGNQLRLNLDTRGTGSARVALLDAEGRPLRGFTADECDAINADDTACVVRWAGRDDLSSLVGRPIRLELTLRNTKFYTLQFVEKSAAGDAA